MKIKEISPNKKDYIIRDLKKDYNNKNFNFKKLFSTYTAFEKWMMEYFTTNKKAGLLNFEIL